MPNISGERKKREEYRDQGVVLDWKASFLSRGARNVVFMVVTITRA
jgi:hypothetical protein